MFERCVSILLDDMHVENRIVSFGSGWVQHTNTRPETNIPPRSIYIKKEGPPEHVILIY